MTERHLTSDPPTASEISAALTDIEAAIDAAEIQVSFDALRAVVGLGGSVTTVTAHALGLATYQPERIHLARSGFEDLEAATTDLLSRPRGQRAALGFMHPGRVDVIGAGALIWRQVLRRIAQRSPQAQVVTSEHDILDGIALSLLG